MKRIGIITIQKCDNFGADLQAYALGAKLRSMGYDAENIDYLFYKHPRHIKGEHEAPVFRLSLVNRIKERVVPFISWLRRKKCNTGDLRRQDLFASFFSENVPCGREYRSVCDLYRSPPEYDVYITGSDQVWNPRMGSNIKPYFLDFVPLGRRCVSYAASIGVPSISPKVYDTYSRLLARYSAIGVREDSAARIIGGMRLAAPVQTVVDPTLLLTAEEWSRVAKRPEEIDPKSYVAEYNLTHHPEIHHLAMRVANHLGIRVIDVTEGCYGPSEFLWLMGNASAIVCCSFHGTVFSIINRVPFYSVYSEGSGKNGGRIAQFAKSFGLGGRMVKVEDIPAVAINLKVDFDKAHRLLDERRNSSLEFLVKSVRGECVRKEMPPAQICYALWAKNAKVRFQSTSGGAFFLIASQIIREGGVVFGAAYGDDCRHVRHRCARTVGELAPLMRSKYVYSDFTVVVPEIADELKSGKKVLFAGCPCQVAAVKAKFAEFGRQLITVDFVCHGTPRPEVFAAWVNDLESRFSDRVVSYEFRNKKRGWNFSDSIVRFASGRVKRLRDYADPYFMGYSLNVFLRECCYSCRYANLNRPGDMTIADCWRVATSHPQFDDGKGTSLVLVNNDIGRAVFEALDKNQYAGGCYDLRLAQLRNSPLMMPAVRSPYADCFNAVFKSTGSLVKSSACYFTPKRRFCSWLRGKVKRLLWFYLKHHQ